MKMTMANQNLLLISYQWFFSDLLLFIALK